MIEIDNNYVFPKRKEIKKNLESIDAFYNDIKDRIKSIDVSNVDFEKVDFDLKVEVKEKQRVFFWVRVYLKEEMEIDPYTDVFIKWLPTGEVLETKFICFSKKGVDKDLNEEIVNYVTDDDKRVLCLMVDEDRININNVDIPFIKSLFKIGRYYQYQVFKNSDVLLSDGNGNELNYFDIDF
jgi:hypothetical protein